jgi:hypothetical protein
MRNNENPFVQIQGLWSQFVENSTAYYSPSVNCKIDEQLLGFETDVHFGSTYQTNLINMELK